MDNCEIFCLSNFFFYCCLHNIFWNMHINFKYSLIMCESSGHDRSKWAFSVCCGASLGWLSNKSVSLIQHRTNFNTSIHLRLYLHLCYPVRWVQGSCGQLFPVAVQNMNLILPFWTRARRRTSAKSPGTQTQQHEDKGRRNGPTFRHFKWLPSESYVANSLNWHVYACKKKHYQIVPAIWYQSNGYILQGYVAVVAGGPVEHSFCTTCVKHPSRGFSSSSQCLEFLPWSG